MTNNHVVEGASKIQVTFSDGTTVPAELIGADPDSDLAVIRVDVDPDRLHPVTMGASSGLRVGQLAIAIGNPFGQEGTMTVGIISALGRLLPTNEFSLDGRPSYSIPEVIQTDAPINPGNSGGVLVDDQGLVIGVTAAIESPVRANSGVGYVIPASIVQRVVPQLISSGSVVHPYLVGQSLALGNFEWGTVAIGKETMLVVEQPDFYVGLLLEEKASPALIASKLEGVLRL